MMYRVSYEDGWFPVTGAASNGTRRTEYFGTEHEALRRAGELVDSGVHHAVSVCDSAGNAIEGVRLQLKLGASLVD
jgi:hypothetical protein